jgi:hypothetical protein
MIPIWLFDMLDMKIQMIWFIPNGWSHGKMLEFDPKIAVWYVCRTSFFVSHSILDDFGVQIYDAGKGFEGIHRDIMGVTMEVRFHVIILVES